MYTAEVEHKLERWHLQCDALWRHIFNIIVQATLSETPLLAFINGHGNIVLPTATSGYAAQLYFRGCTTHSTFKVPVNNKNELLKSLITTQSSRGDFINQAQAIMWDQALMANKAVLACMEEVLRTVSECLELPFSRKVFVLLGDFWQTCPLTTPIHNAENPKFADFVNTIGDRAGPNVALDMLGKVRLENKLIDFVFPVNVLFQPRMCCHWPILTPTNAQVDVYNAFIVDCIKGKQWTYLASDSLKEATEAQLPMPNNNSLLDYAARHTPPGLPPHTLVIKTNAIYCLLHNFSLD
ncbi:uncharacterized protein PHACADRAFT_33811 [Phanerochaete carnosa HHB-10118-sp]|uniref:ATP-dependent DNA helicase n=1 Tax=Phanerochaete carnosa (strain HHB-10118-sp) TaxID=650164 RepID=K5UGJ5_PHACS|nr:uncharacterized protein PHACADRAFT_33811 [Phanerochaete carnosa HHB-10118-sp]EKM48601.1 hypothetical protein PHACADRAFT_33811 [Phanerochaete carnosa HHB-10118-sp]